MRKLLFAAAVLLMAAAISCNTIDDERIPTFPVNISLSPDGVWHTYGVSGYGIYRCFIKDERQPSGFPYTDRTYTGFGGVLLISGMDPFTSEAGVPLAYDLACPVERKAETKVRIQPDGALPAAALERLDSMGRWLRANGETIYGTQAGPVSPRSWGVTTRRGDKIYVHILDWPDEELFVPVRDERIRQAVRFADKRAVAFSQDKAGVTLRLGEKPAGADCIVELTVGK